MAWRQTVSRISNGIFTERNGQPAKIWLDPRLPNFSELSTLISLHGGKVSADHTDSKTTILILHPRSTDVFDQYCHPSWLASSTRPGRTWSQKVILTAAWPEKCVAAGKMLAAEDGWAGFRKGGTPKESNDPRLAPPLQLAQVQTPAPSLRPIIALPIAKDPSTIKPLPNRKIAALPNRAKVIVGAKAMRNTSKAESVVKSRLTKINTPISSLAAARLRRFAKAPKGANESRRTMTTEATDNIIRNAHPMSLRPEHDIRSIKEYLAQTYPEYSLRHWEKRYLDWRAQRGPFTGTSDKSIHTPYVHLYPDYLDDIVAGSSLNDVSELMSDENPEYGLSSSDWNLLFGDWLRTVDPKTMNGWEKVKRVRKRNEAQSEAKIRIAKIFKARYDSSTFRSAVVAEEVSKEVGLTVKTLESHYPHWRNGGHPYFEDLPRDLLFTDAGAPAPDFSLHTETRCVTRSKRSGTEASYEVPDLGAELSMSQHEGQKATPSQRNSTSFTAKIPVDTLDEMIRGAHLHGVMSGDYRDAVQHLTEKHKVYTVTSWRNLYKAWRRREERFAESAKDNEHDKYSALFAAYLPMVKAGYSLEDIAVSLNDGHRKGSIADWSRLFGNWLRVTVAIEDLKSGNRGREVLVERAIQRRIGLAKIFKRDYDSLSIDPNVVASAVSAKTNETKANVTLAYKLWRSRDERYSQIPNKYQPSSTATVQLKRRRSVESSESEGSENEKGFWRAQDHQVVDLCSSDSDDVDESDYEE